ncbi:MAG: OmpA family protein [Acidobacteria bacterium]|nr:OmpA family protein [Acidobacteriota bacterium]
MRKPKYLESDGRHDRWLISYVDIVTILLILFAALAAQAVQRGQVAPPPVKSTAAVVQPPKPPISPELARAKQMLLSKGFELQEEKRGLVISLPQAILYAPGKDQVSKEAGDVVSGIADALRELPNHVILIGHADSSPIHTGRFHNNWELSAARSLRLLELLTQRYGIPEERLSTAGQGAYSPRTSNDTKDGRAANRRVEIVILNEEAPRESLVREKPSPLGRES